MTGKRSLMVSFVVCILLATSASAGDKIHKSANTTQKSRTTQGVDDPRMAQRLFDFKPARELLLQEGVHFDPEVLIRDDNWRETLKSEFATMSQMRQAQSLGRYLKGAVIADTLTVPSEIDIVGDTVILVNRLKLQSRNILFKGNHSIAIFMINTEELTPEALLDFRAKNEVFRLVRLESANFVAPQPAVQEDEADGTITIDTTGAGRQDIVGAKRLLEGTSPYQRVALMTQTTTIDHNGAPGAQGTPGTAATDGLDGPNAPDANNGVCGTATSVNGGNGLGGEHGAPAGNGGEGGSGVGGNPAQPITLSIGQGSTTNYILKANGGDGGIGGVGAPGGRGGKGGDGGDGGDGASCICSQGGTGNGGRAGYGNTGGPGGDGGKGGRGGRGGDGANITVTYFYGYDTNRIVATANPGTPGAGGAGGSGGSGGIGGDPGVPGSAGSNFLCGSDVGIPGAADTGGAPGGPGNTLGSGNAGAVGRRGTIEIYTSTSGGGGVNNNYCPVGGNTNYACLPCYQQNYGCDSPIIVDVADNGFFLTNASEGVGFDLLGIGQQVQVAWTKAGSDDAWLCLDRNNNGLIDNGTELFGARTSQPVSDVKNGYRALAVFDTTTNSGNDNGIIDSNDAVFALLRLWQDTNHNGVSEASELKTLSSLGVTALSFSFRQTDVTDANGNYFRFVSVATISGLNRKTYDVFLQYTVPGH